MSRRHLAAIGLAVLALTVAATSIAVGRLPSRETAVALDDFAPVELRAPTALVAPDPGPREIGPAPAIGDFHEPERSFAARAEPQFDNAPRVVRIATPKPPAPRAAPRAQQPAPAARSGSSASGTASWYCLPGVSACHYQYSGGMYAAAGPALRVGDWRGRVVTVCSGGSCVNVRLIDWCQCYGSRVIDLYSDAFRRLAPLSSGTTRVTVSW